MKTFLIRITIALLTISVTFSQNSAMEFDEWCIANKNAPDDALKAAIDWACQFGGADCSKIKPDQPCFMPNTIQDHASVVFNSYYQQYKNKGGSCYFNGAAKITECDPSHGSCYFEYIP